MAALSAEQLALVLGQASAANGTEKHRFLLTKVAGFCREIFLGVLVHRFRSPLDHYRGITSASGTRIRLSGAEYNEASFT